MTHPDEVLHAILGPRPRGLWLSERLVAVDPDTDPEFEAFYAAARTVGFDRGEAVRAVREHSLREEIAAADAKQGALERAVLLAEARARALGALLPEGSDP